MWYKKYNLEILHVGLKTKHVLHQHRHFHPSGDASPSNEDISTTKRLKECGNILGIELLDHIILGDSNYISLKNNGVI